MFASALQTDLARRSRAVLSAARALLIVEDDNDVDWEVDQEAAAVLHPHRGRLAAAWRAPQHRRRGSLPRPAQVCLSPVARHQAHRVAPATMRAFARPAAGETRRAAHVS
jgi:hypothetical protein